MSACSVTYTPSAANGGTHTITASYHGSTLHLASSGIASLSVNKRHTTTTISCGPIPAPINTSVTCTATVMDVEMNGTKTPPQGTVTFSHLVGVDNGSFTPASGVCTLLTTTTTGATNTCTVTYTSATPTVDSLTATYTPSDDVHLASSTTGSPLLVVFYDASGSFVTGGGTINVLAGSYTANLLLSGQANFGFVSKYQKGASVPDGQTEFQFQVANFDFHSESYQWLVVSGAKAQYKGTGTINGIAGYTFLLTATDSAINGGGTSDSFRIKIWNTATSAIVFDNKMGGSDDFSLSPTEAISGGSIVIHK
jgi:hypothetical protein